MRNLILIFLIILIGCESTLKHETIDRREESPKVNETKEVTTGGVFYFRQFEVGQRFVPRNEIIHGSNGKYELSVASVGNNSISIHYKEYFKPNTIDFDGYKTYDELDTWHIKPGFTFKYDYDLSKSTIFSLKKLQFEILAITDDGVVKYKRIK